MINKLKSIYTVVTFANKLLTTIKVTLSHLCMQEELFYLQVTTLEAQMETLE